VLPELIKNFMTFSHWLTPLKVAEHAKELLQQKSCLLTKKFLVKPKVVQLKKA